MVKKKKLLTLLVILALVRSSRQEDYEEEVFLNKCELDTSKIFDNFKVCTDCYRDLVKAKAEAKKERSELNVTLAELRKWVVEEFSFVRAQAKEMEKLLLSNLPCALFKAKLGNLKLTKLSTGAYFYMSDPEYMAHSAAGAWCTERGMRLAQFETMQEMKIVAENTPNQTEYWVGASNIGYASGSFHWNDRSKVKTEFWDKDLPKKSDAGKEMCVYTWQSSKKLGDWSCTAGMLPLCEMPPEFSTCF